MTERSYRQFVVKLNAIGLRKPIEARAQALHVSLKELYDGTHAPSITAARRDVYLWLAKEGKSKREIARLFDRATNGVAKLMRREAE